MPARPGERRQQILHTLAQMLEAPRGEKITTAALADKLDVSEAALYRHFASKAQMFEGLIEFIEQTLFGLINKITSEQPAGAAHIEPIVSVLLGFAQKNPGMTRVLIGDALVNEHERLQARINQLLDRIEATLKQSLKFAEAEAGHGTDPGIRANILVCYVLGRWHQYAKSGFKRDPLVNWADAAQVLANSPEKPPLRGPATAD
jgi:TetR/AcrR family transcriptional regulator